MYRKGECKEYTVHQFKHTHQHRNTHTRGGKQPLNTSPAEGFPFTEISTDRAGLNCKRGSALESTIPLTARTHPLRARAPDADGGGAARKKRRTREGGKNRADQRDRLIYGNLLNIKRL